MIEEYEERQMIQRAIASIIEAESKSTLNKIGRKRQAKRGHLAIELPVLNMDLVEVHEIVAKNMAYKNKRAKKVVAQTAQQLQEHKPTIQQLEQRRALAQPDNQSLAYKNSRKTWKPKRPYPRR